MDQTWVQARDDFEQNYFEAILIKTKGCVAKAARLADLHRTQVYDRVEKFGIDLKKLKANIKPEKRKPRKGFTPTVDSAERATYAKFATNAEFAKYAEFAEFAEFANEEKLPSKFLQFVREELKK